MERTPTAKNKIIYDVLYGFIRLNEIEWEIIHTPFFQRLRWIKQLGFSSYTFHGAEHSRYGHSIGVMFNAHSILHSIKKAVPDEKLFDESNHEPDTIFHKSIRIAAMLHDLGTFMFSHTTEMAYIEFGKTLNDKEGKGRNDDHEHLGSFIIKNTNYPGGITHILKKYGIDPQRISDLVKGKDSSVLANQILHSEIDCDRMDYLLRDAYYTGLKYGAYDRDYMLHHFSVEQVNNTDILTLKLNALHCVEDFLMARFAWYSQVVRSPRGAKYDALAEEVCFYLLEKGLIYRYSELLDMVANDPVRFYGFNDQYFITLIHKLFLDGSLDKEPRIKDLVESLLFEKSPRTVKAEELKQRILNQDEEQKNDKVLKRANEKIEKIADTLKKHGTSKDWIVIDLPKKDLLFVKSQRNIKKHSGPNILLERDPVKISLGNGEVKLLVDVENSIISNLQKTVNFIPNVFCSDSAYEILKEHQLVVE
ncbi:MAG: HD domain-containing protein [Bacteriovoracaceae bacterium]|nr:HD domain-containing protein [Bacteriovoracaceae bacterium]